MRIGHGYDVHKFIGGDYVTLCGVKIPHTKTLLGHSDADVAAHALMDAMLGALGLGDIGKLFPDTNPRYKGISSMLLLEKVYSIIIEKGYTLGNADITIVAQKPKISPYTADMLQKLAAALDTEPDRLSVKATTEEGLGFTGAEEGIAAHAVVLLDTEERK